MSHKSIKYFCILMTPILILSLFYASFNFECPDTVYVSNTAELSDISIKEKGLLNSVKYGENKISINFLGMLPLKTINVKKVEGLKVYPGGTAVGVKLNTKGVLVVGHTEVENKDGNIISPGKEAGIEVGDIIISVNNSKISCTKDLIKEINLSSDSTATLTILRKDEEILKEVSLIKENDENKLGLWVRDSTSGIGTLTFYDANTEKFGALGHPITDNDTNKIYEIKSGSLLKSSVISVRRGEKGCPGELRGLFVDEAHTIGNITKNTESGIYGSTKENLTNKKYNEPMEIGFRNEIKEGKATIITTIDENGPQEYEIEIVKLLQQEDVGPKSMVIKVTDPVLLEKTGGIVQGMSGSPIIQNGKLVGAVTHVLINKPDVGYGIYIEWMLKDCGIIN